MTVKFCRLKTNMTESFCNDIAALGPLESIGSFEHVVKTHIRGIGHSHLFSDARVVVYMLEAASGRSKPLCEPLNLCFLSSSTDDAFSMELSLDLDV